MRLLDANIRVSLVTILGVKIDLRTVGFPCGKVEIQLEKEAHNLFQLYVKILSKRIRATSRC